MKKYSKPYKRLDRVGWMLGLGAGAPGHTGNGVPVLKLTNLDICYFGRTQIFRIFDPIGHSKIADFEDTEPGRKQLVAFVKANWK